MSANDVMMWILRSPMHAMLSGSLMVVEMTGRKSGKPVTLPVNYFRDAGDYWVVSSRDRIWWRNLQNNPSATLWLGGKPVHSTGEVVLMETTVKERLSHLCAGNARLARAFHIRLDATGKPVEDDLLQVAGERLFVKFIPER